MAAITITLECGCNLIKQHFPMQSQQYKLYECKVWSCTFLCNFLMPDMQTYTYVHTYAHMDTHTHTLTLAQLINSSYRAYVNKGSGSWRKYSLRQEAI